MKKILMTLLWLLMVAMLSVACGDKKPADPVTPKPTLELSNAGPLTFTAQGGLSEQVKIAVTTNSAEWGVTSDQTWCVISQGNKDFSLVAEPYTQTTTERKATVTVTTKEGLKKTISVIQSPLKGIVVAPADLLWQHDQTMEQIVTVTTEQAQWSHALSEGAQTWVTTVLDGSRLKVSLKAANTEIVARTATITFTAGSGATMVTTQLHLMQEGVPAPTISVSPTTLTFTHDATQTQSANVVTNQSDWSHTLSDGANLWLTVVQEGTKLNITPSGANTALVERTATITLNAGTGANAATTTLTVKQAATPAATLTIAPGSLTFGYNSTQAQVVTVTINQSAWSYQISAGSEWVKMSVSGDKLSVTMLTANTGNAPRMATITFSAGSGNNVAAKSMVVTQNIDLNQVAMVDIAAGAFLMGSPELEPHRIPQEGPQHNVTLTRAFKMSKYEISSAQFVEFLNTKSGITVDHVAPYYTAKMTTSTGDGEQKLFMTANGVEENEGILEAIRYTSSTTTWSVVTGRENWAVTCTWFGAKEFALWMGGDLPSEAQWEYACRAGTTTPFSVGAAGNGRKLTRAMANFSGEFAYDLDAIPAGTYVDASAAAYDPKVIIGQFAPNAWGLYDMHGNVTEWTNDWFDNYSAGNQTDPTGPASSYVNAKVIRGQYWTQGQVQAQGARSAMRSGVVWTGTAGFRVIKY